MSSEEIKQILNVLHKLFSKIEKKEPYSFRVVYTPDEESIVKELEKGGIECVKECD